MGSGSALDQLSIAVSGALDDATFSVESNEVSGLLAILQVDDHFELSVVVIMPLLALGHTLAVKRELLLEFAIRPIPQELAHVHAKLPAPLFIQTSLVVIQPIVSEGNATRIVDF